MLYRQFSVWILYSVLTDFTPNSYLAISKKNILDSIEVYAFLKSLTMLNILSLQMLHLESFGFPRGNHTYTLGYTTLLYHLLPDPLDKYNPPCKFPYNED